MDWRSIGRKHPPADSSVDVLAVDGRSNAAAERMCDAVLEAPLRLGRLMVIGWFPVPLASRCVVVMGVQEVFRILGHSVTEVGVNVIIVVHSKISQEIYPEHISQLSGFAREHASFVRATGTVTCWARALARVRR